MNRSPELEPAPELEPELVLPRPVSSARMRPPDVKPLSQEDAPLVWIDCEMTGLNPQKDRILEVAVCRAFFASHVFPVTPPG
jgi:DNA polymerase III epsilon subunit-like protein